MQLRIHAERLFGEPGGADIGRETIRGSAITLVCQVINAILGVISMVFLTRAFTPDDWGVIALAGTVQGFIQPAVDLGLSNAVISRKVVSNQEASNLFWMNMGLGLAVSLVVFLTGFPLARVYHDPRVLPAAAILALTILVGALGLQHDALLRRVLAFKFSAPIGIILPMVALFGALLLKPFMAGFLAITIAQLLGILLTSLARWMAAAWTPKFYDRNTKIGAHVKYGAQLAGGNVLASVGSTIDNTLIGFFYNATQVGLYSRAYNLINAPISRVCFPLFSVLFSALCRIREDRERFLRTVSSSLRILTFICVPLAFVGCANSYFFVHALFGNKWVACVPMFRLLCLVGLVMPLSLLCNTVLSSVERVDLTMKLMSTWAIAVCICFFATVKFSVVAMCGGFVVANAFTVTVSWIAADRASVFPIRKFLRCLEPSILALTLTIVFSLGFNLFVHDYTAQGIASIGSAVFAWALLAKLTPLCKVIQEDLRMIVKNFKRA